MMGLLELIRGNEQQKIERAWNRYAELLAAGSTEKAAVAELENLMGVLGRTAADAAADLTTLQGAQQQVHAISQGSDLDEAIAKALAARNKYRAESDAIFRGREQEYQRLEAEHTRLSRQQFGAHQAVNKLEEMKAERPELLAAFVTPRRPRPSFLLTPAVDVPAVA